MPVERDAASAAAETAESAGFGADGLAVVIGASGAIGGALLAQLASRTGFRRAVGLSRAGTPAVDLTDEPSIAEAAAHVAAQALPIRLVVVATGILHRPAMMPEKSWQQIDPAQMAHAFAVNAIGPALLMKHFLPLLPRSGKAVFATLSARVGSIGDNQLGGWYGYRASKAALNQLVRTAAIELGRRRPQAICVALHPGTVASRLSEPFSARGLQVVAPDDAAARLLAVIDRLGPEQSGGFYDYRGEPLPW